MRYLSFFWLSFFLSAKLFALDGTITQQMGGKETGGLSIGLVWDFSGPRTHVVMNITGSGVNSSVHFYPRVEEEKLYTYTAGQTYYQAVPVDKIRGEMPVIQSIDSAGEESVAGVMCRKFRVRLPGEEMTIWVSMDKYPVCYGFLAPYFKTSREFQALAWGKIPGVVLRSEVFNLSGALISETKTIDYQSLTPAAERFVLPEGLKSAEEVMNKKPK